MRAPSAWVADNCAHEGSGLRGYDDAGKLRCRSCDTVLINQMFVFCFGLATGAAGILLALGFAP